MNKDLMIYIHIPFCIKKCNYCDFVSFNCSLNEYEIYSNNLISEIEHYSLEYKDYIISSIFIGGGTPSVLPVKVITDVITTVYHNYNISKDVEFTIECNPGTLNEEKLITYKELGINRLSIGLQSANDSELLVLGRIHTYNEFLDNYNLARKLGFNNINIDLMSAIPNQTVESYKETLDKVCKLNPEHISAYSLIVEEGTPFYNMELDLPSEDDEREMYYKTKEILESYGYYRYEISNYSKQGFECKHNLGYWERKNYLGLGLNAASFVDKVRWKNTSVLSDYNLCKFEKHELEHLSLKDSMSEYMFLGLRKMAGINCNDFYKHFNVSVQDVFGEHIDKMFFEKLLISVGNNICLTDKGFDLANYVMAGFLLD